MPDQLQIYVATSWRNPLHAEVVRSLRDVGHGVYDFKADGAAFDWREALPPPGTDNGILLKPNDKFLVGPEVYRKMLTHPKACAGFDADMAALKHADVIVALQPFGRSTALELGWATGAGKHTAVVLAEHQELELMLSMVDHIFTSYAPCAAWLKTIAIPAPVEPSFGRTAADLASLKDYLQQVLKSAPTDQIKLDLQSLIRSIPDRRVMIKPENVRQWLRDHAHRDKPHGAIGGHISKTSAATSLGTLETWECWTCGEHAWVDYDL